MTLFYILAYIYLAFIYIAFWPHAYVNVTLFYVHAKWMQVEKYFVFLQFKLNFFCVVLKSIDFFLMLQQFGGILDVEIIFNERGSKVSILLSWCHHNKNENLFLNLLPTCGHGSRLEYLFYICSFCPFIHLENYFELS